MVCIKQPNHTSGRFDRAKLLFWGWLAFLFVLNIVPMGNDLSRSLSGHKFIFRLDYLVHAVTFLCFAGIYSLNWIRRVKIFRQHELPIVISIILVSAILFEAVQYFLPYRSWNPIDLISNLFGSALATLIVLILYICELKKDQKY